MNNSKGISWWIVIIALIVFWPVGLVLLFMKLAKDRSASIAGGKTISIIGWLLSGFGALMFIVFLSDPEFGMFIASIIFIAPGIFLIRKGINTKKKGLRFKKYIDIVINQNQKQIDNIASIFALPYETVKSDLQEMIDKGYFQNAYINESNREIVIKIHEVATSNGIPVKTKNVTCKNCGANQQVSTSGTNQCEYCGTVLS